MLCTVEPRLIGSGVGTDSTSGRQRAAQAAAEVRVVVHLVLFETSANQRYIFATSKRREQVGASELVSRSTTSVLSAAVAQVAGRSDRAEASQPGGDDGPWFGDTNARDHWRWILDSPRIDDASGTDVEVVQATSGRALLLVREAAVAEQLIREVTAQALEHAPGLDICGASTSVDWDGDDLQGRSKRLHLDVFPQARFARPAVEERFLRLPLVEDCATSAWPATRWDPDGPDPGPRSAVTLAKRAAREAWEKRTAALLGDLRSRVDDFEQRVEDGQVDRVALVHADINGLGRILRDLQPDNDGPQADRNRAYVDLLRRVSVALDVLVVLAYQQAVRHLEKTRSDPDRQPPLRPLPLVLGGDDVTVVCDAERALTFTATYLQQLEDLSTTLATLPDDVQPPCGLDQDTLKGLGQALATALGDGGRLAACAGVALIKPHYPHATAHELVQQLTASAKIAARTQGKPPPRQGRPAPTLAPCSVIDFEVVQDTGDVDLRRLRAELERTEQVRLTLRPYAVTDPAGLGDTEQWGERHSWQRLASRCAAVREGLPSSPLHALQELLLVLPDRAERRYQALCARHPGANALATADGQLLADVPAPRATQPEVRHSGLIDALVAAPYLS